MRAGEGGVHPGVVTTDATTADRTYIRQAATPADAAGRAAALHGISLPSQAAREIADAVLGHADSKVSVSVVVTSLAAGYPDIFEHALKQLRHQLYGEVISKGLLPTALPSETRAYTSWHVQPGSLLGPWDPWTQVEITLTVPVRTP